MVDDDYLMILIVSNRWEWISMEDNGNMQTFKQLVILVDITIEREVDIIYLPRNSADAKKNSDLRFMIKITVFWIEPKKRLKCLKIMF